MNEPKLIAPTAASRPKPNVASRVSRLSHRSRRALVLLETIVAALLVLALLSVAAPMIVQSARIWKQTRHYQFAGDELSGQMDRLIAMPAPARMEALEELSVSPEVSNVLHDAMLTGNVVQDDDGKRIELTITWEQAVSGPSVKLVAWILPIEQSNQNGESES